MTGLPIASLAKRIGWQRGSARLCLAPLLVCTLAISLPAAAGPTERWTATSTNALSITGNVSFSAERITFFNGRSLALSSPVQVASFMVSDKPVEATLYRVVKPRAVKLKNGNYLCGSAEKPKVTFIAVWKPAALPGEMAARTMQAFSSKEQPVSAQAPGRCGIYHYETR
jgi:hypothetical protein